VLVPKLLRAGHTVRVLDLFIYGREVLDSVKNSPGLTQIAGDIRDPAVVKAAVHGCDSVIHLACISNDPSFELDPALGKSINYDSFLPLVRISRDAGVRRFIYASSSSVYGIKDEPDVTEDLPLKPLTDYSKYKAMCEEVLDRERQPGFSALTLRPATVCGYSPRLRLDLSVNILTNHAYNNRMIRVFGGAQRRPNIHIEDVTDLYVKALEWPAEKIDGRVYNAGYQNHTIMELAGIVQSCVGPDVKVVTEPTNDLRSYHISSGRIMRELGFTPAHDIKDAVQGLCVAFHDGAVPASMTDSRYYNIKRMQEVRLS
jgi:nucleoside-diphosphate-sugar epimerase